MKVTFLGTGDSCDPAHKNLSVLLENHGRAHLLDCGFSSTHGYLARSAQVKLDTVWISHFHGDHFFGLPQLILHFYMEKRTEPLSILSGENGEEKILGALQLAYPELATRLSFSLDFIELPPETTLRHNGLSWQCAPVTHSQSANGLRISSDSKSLYYSGDGKVTQAGKKLMQNCDFVIHEAFSIKSGSPYHCSIEECLLMAEELAISKLALVHLSPETRQIIDAGTTILNRPKHTTLLFPQDNEKLTL